MDVYRFLFLLINVFRATEGVTLTVPDAGNCYGEAILTCTYAGALGGSWSWTKEGTGGIVTNGIVKQGLEGKYEEVRDSVGSFSLKVNSMDISDRGNYRCYHGYDDSGLKPLKYECKAKTATLEIKKDKKVYFTVDRLYPDSKVFTLSGLNVGGSHQCRDSSQYAGHKTCEWTSSRPLPAGSYSYSVTVTTVTQAAPINGTFTIVSPNQPSFTNTETIDSGRAVIRGVEDQLLKVQCVSRGGYPQPTVVLYQGSTSGSGIATQDSGIRGPDNTYTVTLNHQLSTARQNDMESYICRSYYPAAATTGYRDIKDETVELYLALRPSKPKVSQTRSVIAGETMTLQCSSTGSRPAASVSWTFRGQLYSGSTSVTSDIVTETFSLQSFLKKTVGKEDNGQLVQCSVSHPNFAALNGSVSLNVAFSSLDTTIEGNAVTVADGSNTLDLTCTSDSSNPVSVITWNVGGVQSSLVREDNVAGDNGGTRRRSIMRMTPTRNDDGATVTCSASNNIGSAPSSAQVNLELQYSPEITTADILKNEGQTVFIQCKASSKPPSLFIWKKGSDKVDEGLGTAENNKYDYIIANVDRSQAGSYTCTADNGIDPAASAIAKLTVYYAPDIQVSTSTNSIKETDPLHINCIPSGLPADYNYGGFVQTWRGVPIRSYAGQSTVRIDSLQLDHSGTYTCTANNNITDRSGTLNQEGSKNLLVQGKPKVLAVDNKFSGTPGESVNISIPFYSYPAVTSSQSVLIRRDGVLIHDDSRVTNVVATADVNAMFYGIPVTLDGRIVNLLISNITEMDLSNYTVEIENDIGSSQWPFAINSIGPPLTPQQFDIVVSLSTPTFTWNSGYNGGYQQTFLIEVSTEGTNEWREKVSVGEYDTSHKLSNGFHIAEVSGLEPGTYIARISSTNKIEKSDSLELKSSFVVSKDNTCGCSMSDAMRDSQVSAGAVAGGVIAGLEAIALTVIAVLFLMRRKQLKCLSRKDTDSGNEDQDVSKVRETQRTYENYGNVDSNTDSTEDLGHTSRNVYEQLDPAMKKEGDTVYSVMKPTQEERQSDVRKEYVNLKVYNT